MLTIKTYSLSEDGVQTVEYISPMLERLAGSILDIVDDDRTMAPEPGECPPKDPPENPIAGGCGDKGKPMPAIVLTNENRELIFTHFKHQIEEALEESNGVLLTFNISPLNCSEDIALKYKPSGGWLGRMFVEGVSLGMSPEQVEAIIQSQPPTFWHALEQLEADPKLEINRLRQINRLKGMAATKPSPEEDPTVNLANCLVTEVLAVFRDAMAGRSAKSSGASKPSPAIPYNTWIVQVEKAAAARRVSKNLTRHITRAQPPGAWVDMWKQHLTPDQAWLHVATKWAKNNSGANVGDLS